MKCREKAGHIFVAYYGRSEMKTKVLSGIDSTLVSISKALLSYSSMHSSTPSTASSCEAKTLMTTLQRFDEESHSLEQILEYL
jgi:hypothetical protein